jgi:hypothetical protein
MAHISLLRRARGGVSFAGMQLRHFGARSALPIWVEQTSGRVNTYTSTRVEVGRPAYKVEYHLDIYPGITLRLPAEPSRPDFLWYPRLIPRSSALNMNDSKHEWMALTWLSDNLAKSHRLSGFRNFVGRYRIDQVRFEIEPHDPKQPLVIDPYVITRSVVFRRPPDG